MSTDLLRGIAPKRICVIKPSALGDIAQSLPLAEALKDRFPDVHLAWVANREYAELLEAHPLLDEVIPFGRRDAWDRIGAWIRLLSWLRGLRRRRFDLVLDLQGLARTALMGLATDAPLRIGLETAREGSHLFCHHILAGTSRSVPAHERYRRVAEALGCRLFPSTVPFRLDKAAADWVAETLRPLSRPILAVHPGARWMSKRWPAEKFASVAGKAVRKLGFSVAILGARADVRTATSIEALLEQFVPGGRVLNLAGKTDLLQLAALLRAADVLLCNDSGPMHLAAALGTPVLAVFTCTSPERSGPPGPQHELIQAPTACAGAYRKRCPLRGKKHLMCMEQLATDRVFQALGRMVERHRAARAA